MTEVNVHRVQTMEEAADLINQIIAGGFDGKKSKGAEPAGHSVPTIGGRSVSVASPKPETIFLTDIAASISKMNEYQGHTNGFYSVAQRGVLVSLEAERRAKLSLDAARNEGFKFTGEEIAETIRYAGIIPMLSAAVSAYFYMPDNCHDQRSMLVETLENIGAEIGQAIATALIGKAPWSKLILSEIRQRSVTAANRYIAKVELRDILPPGFPVKTGKPCDCDDCKIDRFLTIVPLTPLAAEAYFLQQARRLGFKERYTKPEAARQEAAR